MEPREYTIEELEAQEGFEFPSMNNEDAVALGEVAIETIRESGLSLCVEIVVGGDTLFLAKLGSTGAGNNPWLSRKAAVVRHFGHSSFLLRKKLQRDGQTLDQVVDDPEQFAAAGGSLPIRVNGEIVGTITMSGEPDWIDHYVNYEAVQRYLARR